MLIHLSDTRHVVYVYVLSMHTHMPNVEPMKFHANEHINKTNYIYHIIKLQRDVGTNTHAWQIDCSLNTVYLFNIVSL